MKIKRSRYKGLSCYSIENDLIRLVILPKLGAKIASMFYKPQQFEVLFQPSTGRYRTASYGANFSEYDTSGADEMFPTIDPCCYPAGDYEGITLPDHGELWSLPSKVTINKDSFTTTIEGCALPYIFSRSVSLSKDTVCFGYNVLNTGSTALYGLWAFHGLVACDEFTRIIMPGVSEVVNVHDSDLLGAEGTRHSFPVSNSVKGCQVQLNKIGLSSLAKTEKYYAAENQATGTASLTLNNGKLLYKLVFPTDRVPYLGVWINEGGFKGEYNCALEPSSGYYDRLDKAYLLNSLKELRPGEFHEWYLKISLLPIGKTLDSELL